MSSCCLFRTFSAQALHQGGVPAERDRACQHIGHVPLPRHVRPGAARAVDASQLQP